VTGYAGEPDFAIIFQLVECGQHFLAGHIPFLYIPHALDDALSAHAPTPDPSLDEVLAADAWARSFAEDWVKAKT
jgi:1-deoxy-D-xylulose-5-phosphate reductoisomerase